MKERPQNLDTQILFYLLSEIFEIFKSTEAHDDSLLSRAFRRYEAPWQILQQRLNEITSAHSLNATSRLLGPTFQEYDERRLGQQPSLLGNQKHLLLPEITAGTERAAEPLPDGLQLPVYLHSHESTSSFARSSWTKRRKSSRSSSTSNSAPRQADMDAGWPLSDSTHPNTRVRTVPPTPRSSVSNSGDGFFSNSAFVEITQPDAWEKWKSPRADDALHELPTDWTDVLNI
jgi:hypothetical protein